VPGASDFNITGDGSNAAWQKCAWTALTKRGQGGQPYDARFKLLYSGKGIYLLMQGSDQKITATFQKDFEDLWTEDVFEAFFWTDERYPLYFEYEISPLGFELPIIIPNLDGKILGWRPWHYEGERKIKKATAVTGGEKKPGASITGWSAEVFIPYVLLTPLTNVPPRSGSRWRANFYRVDHDGGKSTGWHWAPVGPSFHEFQKYGTLIFD
jgi:hypothetical protein